ncbi:hypothetical protein GCM10007047_07230 [Cerasicoccus arenae]|uniref:Uncharacterized protein n=1 Tax=Cerasicoccus arenae TaxID=424488 RepID=A0A8J3DFX4_9BACT|nr:hypothetical protein GCM10007047_07230 [Cerasicoccus arenae]
MCHDCYQAAHVAALMSMQHPPANTAKVGTLTFMLEQEFKVEPSVPTGLNCLTTNRMEQPGRDTGLHL